LESGRTDCHALRLTIQERPPAKAAFSLFGTARATCGCRPWYLDAAESHEKQNEISVSRLTMHLRIWA